MQRLVVFIGITTFLALLPAAAQGHDPVGQLRVPFAQAESLLTARGILIPTKSCLRAANQARCPQVRDVVISSTGEYGGELTARAIRHIAGLGPQFHDPGYACAIESFKPIVETVASSYGRNHCWGGVGVTWMEMWNNIEQYKPSDATWYTMDNCYRSYAGATTLSCTAIYDCYHPGLIKDYRGKGSAYSIRNGVGYFGTDLSSVTSSFCG